MRCLLVLLVVAVGAQAQLNILNFNDFVNVFKKSYSSPEETALRQSIFNSNALKVQAHNQLFNSGRVTYKLALNAYADLTQDEFNSKMKGLKMPSITQSSGPVHKASLKSLPDSVDWRTEGAVTPVKDQKQCGSCYSFATTGTLEGQWFLNRGELIPFSEQQIVDCSRDYGNYGCDGGLMTNSYKYILEAGGIEGEADYPYTATNGTCNFDSTLVKGNLTSWVNIPQFDETALQDAVANVGPVAIAIDATSPTFQFYSSGVYTNFLCSSIRLDHAVLAVGYGSVRGFLGIRRDFWIVKNSWGTSWGEDGYIRMSRNLFNQCGVATMASYPIL